ncbi:hypothetical protein, partial [Gemmiger sp.]|uniref:hypothetical protein n=1 Tax=Gemmiger sp. TaxID=2049027 RepID=UPI00307E9E89
PTFKVPQVSVLFNFQGPAPSLARQLSYYTTPIRKCQHLFSDFLTNFPKSISAQNISPESLQKKLAPQVCAVGLRGGQYLRAVGFAVDRTPGTAQVPSATTLTVTPGLSVSPHSR